MSRQRNFFIRVETAKLNMNLKHKVNWPNWIERYDKMQERYFVQRSERFGIITKLIKTVCQNPAIIIDLGCGTGSLTKKLLEEFNSAKVLAIDSDPAVLLLAEHRLKPFGNRGEIIQSDINKLDWGKYNVINAVVSSSALHWFSSENLEKTYCRIFKCLKKGGVFLNADHAGSCSRPIQQYWESNRRQMLQEQVKSADDWDGFWQQFLAELGKDAQIERQKAIGQWEGTEEGMPMQWHFEKLEQCGFGYVDCFWRCDCDVVYGAVKQ